MIIGTNPQTIFDSIAKELLLIFITNFDSGVETKFLGRVLQHKGDYIVIAMSDEYIDTMLDDFGLKDCKGAITPGTSGRKTTDGVSQLDSQGATNYRKGVGKLMWITPIRADIYFAVKELSRALREPTEDDLARLKHALRYVSGTRNYTLIIKPTVKATNHIETTCAVDSDWAGCQDTRKSTSGGVLRILGSALHAYARTQSTIATSSGEAELYAIGSGASEALGAAQFLQESRLALTTSITIETDSTAAKSIATRTGVSKLTKHIQFRFLYIQDLVKNSVLRIVKVHTSVNPADVMTKHLTQHVLKKHLDNLGLWCEDGFDFGTREASVVNSTMHDSSQTLLLG